MVSTDHPYYHDLHQLFCSFSDSEEFTGVFYIGKTLIVSQKDSMGSQDRRNLLLGQKLTLVDITRSKIY